MAVCRLSENVITALCELQELAVSAPIGGALKASKISVCSAIFSASSTSMCPILLLNMTEHFGVRQSAYCLIAAVVNAEK